ncbi:MAG: hypothetical protein ACK4UN_18130, partial [Limisphaerales bacterium]
SVKAWNDSGLMLPVSTSFLIQFGPFLFLLPLFWITATMTIRQRPSISDDARYLVDLMGPVLLLGLIFFELYSIVSPWLRIFQAGFGTSVEVE